MEIRKSVELTAELKKGEELVAVLSSTVHAEQTSMTSFNYSIIDKVLYKEGLQKHREDIRSFLAEVFEVEDERI